MHVTIQNMRGTFSEDIEGFDNPKDALEPLFEALNIGDVVTGENIDPRLRRFTLHYRENRNPSLSAGDLVCFATDRYTVMYECSNVGWKVLSFV